jgi:hypothetical protein
MIGVVLFGGKTKMEINVQHNGALLQKTVLILSLQKKTLCLTIG